MQGLTAIKKKKREKNEANWNTKVTKHDTKTKQCYIVASDQVLFKTIVQLFLKKDTSK